MSEQNKTAMQRFYDEVFNAGNTDQIDQLVASDFVEHEQFPGLMPGPEGLKQFVTMMHAAFADMKMEVQDMIAEGDKVVARVSMSGTQRAEFAGIPSAGKAFCVTAIDIIRFADGIAVEHWGATDSAAMMQQLGAVGPGS